MNARRIVPAVMLVAAACGGSDDGGGCGPTDPSCRVPGTLEVRLNGPAAVHGGAILELTGDSIGTVTSVDGSVVVRRVSPTLVRVIVRASLTSAGAFLRVTVPDTRDAARARYEQGSSVLQLSGPQADGWRRRDPASYSLKFSSTN